MDEHLKLITAELINLMRQWRSKKTRSAESKKLCSDHADALERIVSHVASK